MIIWIRHIEWHTKNEYYLWLDIYNIDHFPLKRLEVVTARLVDSKRTRKQVQLFCSAESLTKLKREKGTIVRYRVCFY
ncbi:unnamed protein product [Rhizopus stolonifer]